MIIDRSHRPWLVASCGAFALAGIGYAWHASTWHAGPTGASPAGLAFGIAGYALMLFAGLLGARKKVPTWRLGRAQTWMRGHLWLGLLSFPLILFHGGFAWRGPLTAILMLLLFIVIISGIFGAALQHILPRIMTAQVPLETIFEEIPHIRAQLLADADELALAANVEAEIGDRSRFDEIYRNRIRPHLESPPAGMFFAIRASVVPAFYPAIAGLERICEEQRQLNRQTRLYHWLHAWLLVHVPLSIALLVLGGIHAVVALRY
jgi:hypothetical protein